MAKILVGTEMVVFSFLLSFPPNITFRETFIKLLFSSETSQNQVDCGPRAAYPTLYKGELKTAANAHFILYTYQNARIKQRKRRETP